MKVSFVLVFGLVTAVFTEELNSFQLNSIPVVSYVSPNFSPNKERLKEC